MTDIKSKKSSDEEKFEIEDMPSEEEGEVSDEEPTIESPDPGPENESQVETTEELEEPDISEEGNEVEIKEEVPKAISIKKSKPFKKIKPRSLLIILITALVTAGLVVAGYYLYQTFRATPEKEATPRLVEEVPKEEPKKESEFVFVNSTVGLNLREEPSVQGKLLTIVPFNTKLEVLEEKSDWYKTEYEKQVGWISKGFVSSTSPLIYEDSVYGYKLTFLPGWAGYKFFEAKNIETTVSKIYYVAIPTKDSTWDESQSGIPKGYSSLFVMGVYTKAEWAKMEGEEMKPGKLGENDKYVFTYLPGQAHPTDLKLQYGQINDIIKTFEALK